MTRRTVYLPERHLFRRNERVHVTFSLPSGEVVGISKVLEGDGAMKNETPLGHGQVSVIAVDREAPGALMEALDEAFQQAAEKAHASLDSLHGGPISGDYRVTVSLLTSPDKGGDVPGGRDP